MRPNAPLTYRQAGVNTVAGDSLVERIKPFAKATHIPEVIGALGGFAGLCSVPTGIDDPVLVSGTDGVGTKLKVAFMMGIHDTIGIDLVAMCVNDILTTGARPLFFLDYFATSALNEDVATEVIRGIARGCQETGCALLGGETAELPGMYADGEYDLAGFAVGVVARAKMIDGTRVAEGDIVVGLASCGLHSNGFSLARAVLFDAMQLSMTDTPPELDGETVGAALLTPTRLYVRAIQALQAAGVDIRAMSHITGGGLPGNLPRVLGNGLGVRIDQTWTRPPIFSLLTRESRIERTELRRTFNDGIGFVVVVPRTEQVRVLAILKGAGETPVALGEVVRLPYDTEFEDRVVYPEVVRD